VWGGGDLAHLDALTNVERDAGWDGGREAGAVRSEDRVRGEIRDVHRVRTQPLRGVTAHGDGRTREEVTVVGQQLSASGWSGLTTRSKAQ
jgi:hypothetical protein